MNNSKKFLLLAQILFVLVVPNVAAVEPCDSNTAADYFDAYCYEGGVGVCTINNTGGVNFTCYPEEMISASGRLNGRESESGDRVEQMKTPIVSDDLDGF